MAEPAGTVLGFDFGTQRIGVAVGNAITGTASPVRVLPARDGVPDWDAVRALVDEWRPARLVVGLPLNMDGTESDLSARARSFGRKLNGRLALPVDMVDERLTSFEARGQLMRSANRRGKPAVDALAAVLIVEDWLAGQGQQGIPDDATT